jgi:DNA-directed RNA polymerase subunit alpha
METTLDLTTIFEQESFDAASCEAVKELAFAGRESLNRLLELLVDLERKAERREVDPAKAAYKVGVCYLWLGSVEKAAQWLDKAEDVAGKSYHMGLVLREQRRYAESVGRFEEAARQGADALDCDCQRAESLVLAGEVEKARQVLDGHATAGARSAQWHYAMGRCLESGGELEQAMEALERALACNDLHPQATFHLAYLLHLHGSDERAKELYTRATEFPYVHFNTLINLSVIYEDDCEYEKAVECLQRVLAVDPNHKRAQLFLKDVQAAEEMYIDEQQIMDSEKRNAVLDIPVSDFELSVRSRNCLKKMNIHTLGDLLRTAESELLSYKNFGETSLKEIRVMLKQKGLVLGQLVHERLPEAPAMLADREKSESSASEELLDTLVSTLNLSVRSRKCLQLLGIFTIRELLQRSEEELLASPNFGQTSLEEVQVELKARGLSLKES